MLHEICNIQRRGMNPVKELGVVDKKRMGWYLNAMNVNPFCMDK